MEATRSSRRDENKRRIHAQLHSPDSTAPLCTSSARATIFPGNTDYPNSNSVYKLTAGTTPATATLTPLPTNYPTRAAFAVSAIAAPFDGVGTIIATGGATVYNDVWWYSTTGALATGSPNQALQKLWIRVTLSNVWSPRHYHSTTADVEGLVLIVATGIGPTSPATTLQPTDPGTPLTDVRKVTALHHIPSGLPLTPPHPRSISHFFAVSPLTTAPVSPCPRCACALSCAQMSWPGAPSRRSCISSQPRPDGQHARAQRCFSSTTGCSCRGEPRTAPSKTPPSWTTCG